MKKTINLFILLGIIFLFTDTAGAFPISAGDTVKMTTEQGNPFTMTLLDSAGQDVEKFNAFCVELGISFTPGHSYEVDSVEDFATSGSGGAVGGKDPISDESKWLYASYFDGVWDNSGIADLALTVQRAIWLMEDEGTGGVFQDAWDTLAGSTTNFTISGWDIKVVNLIGADGTDIQSQLVGNEVPEPATILLFGAGLAGLIGFSRRKK